MSDNPFRYSTGINNGENLIVGNDYSQFLINRSFSFFIDTIFIANEANMRPSTDNQMHYDFMRSMIRPKKRFSGKWPKPIKHKQASLISQFYKISMDEAYALVPIFSDEELNTIEDHLKELAK